MANSPTELARPPQALALKNVSSGEHTESCYCCWPLRLNMHFLSTLGTRKEEMSHPWPCPHGIHPGQGHHGPQSTFYSILIPSLRPLFAEQSSYYSSPRFTDDVKFRGRSHAGQQRRAEM